MTTLAGHWAGLQQEAERDEVIKVVRVEGTHPLRQGWGQKPVLLLLPGQGVLCACPLAGRMPMDGAKGTNK